MSSEFNDSIESPGFLLWQVTNIWQKDIRRALEPFEIDTPTVRAALFLPMVDTLERTSLQ